MHDILISSPAFTNDKSLQYILSIQLCLDGFSFSICDTLSNKYIHLYHKSFPKNTDVIKETIELLEKKELLQLSYKNVFIAYELSAASNVPRALFDYNAMNELYQLSYILGENETVIYDDHERLNSINIYALNIALKAQLDKQFPKFVLNHIFTVKSLTKPIPTEREQQIVLLSVRQDQFSISVYQSGKLLLQNLYSYQNDDEFLFFFMYCFNQLKLDQYKAQLILDGIVPKHAGLIKQLKRFVKDIVFATWPEAFNYANDFYDLPSHYFTHVYNNILCE